MGERWKTHITLVNEFIGKQEVILIDYCNLPIYYRYYLSTDHFIKDCHRVLGRQRKQCRNKVMEQRHMGRQRQTRWRPYEGLYKFRGAAG